jgi:biopolymer transport protein TolQ
MKVDTNMSIISLITQASVPVQIVMGILVLASLISWTYIFMKFFQIGGAAKAAVKFEDEFWSGQDMVGIYQRAEQKGARSGMERVFVAGFKEFLKSRQRAGADVGSLMDGVRRAMKATYQREFDALDSHLPFLATVGSVSPYIGLLGTVWGIMNSFRGLSSVAQATLAQVAPGIAEALIATAIGLFAAIPAVIAFNRFTAQNERLANRYESFIEEVSNIIQRQAQQALQGK